MNSPSGKRWRVWALCAGIWFLGAILFTAGLTSYSSARAYVDRFSGDGSADPYTPPLHQRLQNAALLVSGTLFVLGLVIIVTSIRSSKNDALASDTQARASVLQFVTPNALELRQLVLQTVSRCRWLLVCMSVLFAIVHLVPSQPTIRFDEAISWRDYSAKPIWITVAKYDTPNNHIFFNLLSGRLIGTFGDSLYVLRFISFVSGLSVILFTVLFTSAISNRLAALLAAVALTFNPAFYEYSIYARGYALLTCLWLVSTITLAIAIQKNNWLSLFLSAICCSLGFWTVPVMLYPFLTTLLFFSILTVTKSPTRAHNLKKLAIWSVTSILLAFIFYTPVLLVSGHQAITSNRYVESMNINDWLEGLPHWVFNCQLFLLNTISTGRLYCLAFPIAVCLFGLWRNRSYRTWLLASIVCFLSILVFLGLQRVLPPPRTWVWISVPLSILLAVGWAEAIAAVFGSMREKHRLLTNERMEAAIPETTLTSQRMISGCVLLLLFIAPTSFDILSGKLLNSSLEGGRCDGAEASAKFLSENVLPFEPIIAVCPASGTLDYYGKRHGMPLYHFDPPQMVWKASLEKQPRTGALTESLNQPEISNESAQKLQRSVIVAVVNNRAFDQGLEGVLADLMHSKPVLDWKFDIVFHDQDVTLYRVYGNDSFHISLEELLSGQ